MIRLFPDPVVVASAGPLPSATLHETTVVRHECRTYHDRPRWSRCQQVTVWRPGSLLLRACRLPRGGQLHTRFNGRALKVSSLEMVVTNSEQDLAFCILSDP